MGKHLPSAQPVFNVWLKASSEPRMNFDHNNLELNYIDWLLIVWSVVIANTIHK